LTVVLDSEIKSFRIVGQLMFIGIVNKNGLPVFVHTIDFLAYQMFLGGLNKGSSLSQAR